MAGPPPPPPGFTIDQPKAAAPPPPPPGFKLDQPPAGAAPAPATPAKPGFLQQTAESFADIPREMKKQSGQAVEDIKGDFTAPLHGEPKKGVGNYISKDVGSQGYEKPGVLDYAARGGKTALDVLNYGSGGAALQGAATSIVGRPGEKLTGIPKEKIGEYTAMAVPFAGEVMPAARAAGALVKDGFKAVEKVFSPTTVSPVAGATERTIRRATGEASLQNEKAADTLVQHNKVLANLPVQQQRGIVDYIENRSKLPPGAKLADPKMQAAADDIGKVYEGWRNKITQTLKPDQVPNFIQDYYSHIWKDKPTVVADKLGSAAKQGSGRSFKARMIPTISDGIKAGLTPKFENPIESTMAYSQNMSRYVATHDMLNELKSQGYAKWYGPGSKNIPQGWVPLDGIMTKKTAPMTAGGAVTGGRPIQLYAPQDAARVFNNFISKGMDKGDAAPFYQAARATANGMTQLKLGLSAYHLATMANEAVISDYARAFRAASRGEFKTAARAAGSGLANIPTIGGKTAMRGLKMQRELLDKAMPDAMSKVVNDAFVRSGGTLKMDPFYRTRASGSFFNAIEKGTFKKELKEAAEHIYDKPLRGTVDLASNIIQTTAAPLFEKYIPMVKRGAFASEMEDFLKAKPAATQAEIDKEAIKIADSIDNRFGELNQDNLFWNKTLKQAAQIALLSPTWTLGTVREIAGGLKDAGMAVGDIGKGEGLSRRAAYIAGLAANTAMMSAAYQYLKTGKAPGGARDLMAPQTGGTDVTSHQPERVLTPGYQKDVYAFGYDFPNHILDESVNKLNPAVQTGRALITNKDYQGHDVFRPEGAPKLPGEDEKLRDFLMDQFLPISISQFGSKKKGTNISGGESALGLRAAPSYITAPERTQALKEKYNTKDWKTAVKAYLKQKDQKQ